MLASLCTEAEQKYGAGILEEERDGFTFLPGRRKTQQASASGAVPSSGIREDFICGASSPGYRIRIKVAKVLPSSFPLHYFKTVIAGVRPPRNWGPAVW